MAVRSLGLLTLDLVAKINQYTEPMSKAERATADATRKMNSNLGGVEKSIDRLGDASERTRRLVGSLVATAGVGISVSGIVKAADSYTELNNQLKLVTSSQVGLQTALDDTFRIAQNTASTWSSVSDVYQKFAKQSEALGLSQERVAGITETVTKAVAMSGATAAASEAALLQFGQALNTGYLRGVELTSVMSQTPGLAKAIADGMGVSVGELKGLGEQGKITTEVMIAALEKMSKGVSDEYDKTATTVSSSFNLISNGVKKFVGETDKSLGASENFVSAVRLVSENLDTMTEVAMVGGAYLGGKYVYSIYASIAATGQRIASTLNQIKTDNDAIITSQRKAQAEYNAAQAEMSSARAAVLAAEMEVNANRAVIASEIQRVEASLSSMNAERAAEAVRLKAQITDTGRAMSMARMIELQKVQALMVSELSALETKYASTTIASSKVFEAARNAQTAATGRLTAATAGLNAANALTTRSSIGLLGALGGPVGLGITAATVAAGYLLMRDSSDKTVKSFDTQGISIEELITKYNEMSEAQQRAFKYQETKTLMELKEAYQDASDQVWMYANSLKNGVITSEQSQTQLTGLISKYRAGDISANDFADGVSQLNGVTDAHIAALVKHTDAANKSNAKMDQQETIVGTLSTELDKAAKNQDKLNKKMTAAESAAKTAQEAYAKYVAGFNTEKLAAVFDNTLLNKYGDQFSKELRKMQAEWAKYYNYDPEQLRSPAARTDFRERYKVVELLQQTSKLEDDLSKKEAAKTKEMEKQAKLRKAMSIDAVIASGEGNYKSVNLGKSKGYQSSSRNLTGMTIGEVMAAQAAKEFNAAGKYQVVPSTLKEAVNYLKLDKNMLFSPETQEKIFKEYLVSVKRPEIKGFITGSDGANLNAALVGGSKEFASVANPATGKSYWAGTANNKASISAEQFTESLLAQQKVYRENIALGMDSEQAWLKSFNSSAVVAKSEVIDVDKFLDDYVNYLDDQKKARDDFTAAYLSNDSKLYDDYLKTISKATELFTGDELNRYTEMEKQRYTAAATLSNLQFEEQVDGWKWVGEEKIRKDAEINKAILDASTELSDAQKAIAKQSVNDQAAYELQEFKRTQQEKIAQAAMAIADIRTEAQDYMLQQSDPRAYAWSMLERQQNSETSGLDKAYQGQVSSINELDDIQERNSQLLAAQQQYLQARADLDSKYALQGKELRDSEYQAQLDVWGQMASQAQSTWGMMTQSVKDASGEQSSAYKTMFAMQQAFAIASAIISTEQSAAKALELGPILGIPASTLVRTMGYANVALIAAQTVAGFSDGGYTGSGAKYAPAGVVHKGEVVWSQDDIKRWGGVGVVESMRTSSPGGYADGGVVDRDVRTVNAIQSRSGYGQSGGDVNVNITVNQDGSSSTDVQGGQQKAAADTLANGFRKIIMQECRQGGIIYNYVRS
ncbi:tape measure protein [Acinetobacter puyangensis]|uniref:tape measure protein n=1 Tax=Acinetobacter puyangensis TaxID=1096779 RepID=UPI003A4D7ACA